MRTQKPHGKYGEIRLISLSSLRTVTCMTAEEKESTEFDEVIIVRSRTQLKHYKTSLSRQNILGNMQLRFNI
jgi:hypothetical protein